MPGEDQAGADPPGAGESSSNSGPGLSVPEAGPHPSQSASPHTAVTREDTPSQPRTEGTEWVLHLTSRLFFTLLRNEDETVRQIRKYPVLFYFSNPLAEMYEPFCEDFGPVNISVVCQFCEDLRARVCDPRLENRMLVFYGYAGNAQVTANMVFLLMAFLTMDLGMSVEEAASKFEGLNLPRFRDATYTVPTYFLTGADILHGLRRAREVSWFDHRTFDIDAYEDTYDVKVDMVRLTPRFAAFSAPRPARIEPLLDAFTEAGVTDIVRLNSGATDYPREAFTALGMSVHDLCFEDCTCPAPSVVRRFLDVCDVARGVVAVHCLAGLGRTGTLIGCHMIKHHGFTAREAIGYLRVMRPGSVIGRQQHYLELVAMSEWDGNTPVLCGEAGEEEEEAGAACDGGEAAEQGAACTDPGSASPLGPVENPSSRSFVSTHQSKEDRRIASQVAQAHQRRRADASGGAAGGGGGGAGAVGPGEE